MAQLMGQLVFDLLPLQPKAFPVHLARPMVAPQLVGLLQGVQYTFPKLARLSTFGFHDFFEIAHQMREALLLIHSGQLVGFVAGTSIRYQSALVVARHQFPHLLVAMLGADLVDGGLVGVEHHQLGWLTTYCPTGVVGVGDWCVADPSAGLLIGIAHHAGGLLEGVPRHGALPSALPRSSPVEWPVAGARAPRSHSAARVPWSSVWDPPGARSPRIGPQLLRNASPAHSFRKPYTRTRPRHRLSLPVGAEPVCPWWSPGRSAAISTLPRSRGSACSSLAPRPGRPRRPPVGHRGAGRVPVRASGRGVWGGLCVCLWKMAWPTELCSGEAFPAFSLLRATDHSRSGPESIPRGGIGFLLPNPRSVGDRLPAPVQSSRLR